MYTEDSHIHTWLLDHRAFTLPVNLSKDFNSYLSGFPWGYSRVNWSSLDYKDLFLPEIPDDHFISLCKETPWGKHGHIFVMYAWDEPSIICDLQEGLVDLDLLYSSAAGYRYFCGAEIKGNTIEIFFSDFAEYNGHSDLRFLKNQDSFSVKFEKVQS